MVTIADVARHAGVSSSTVSYVLSGKRAISEETRRRVQSSVQELGYHLLNTVTWFKPNASPNLACRFFTHSTELLIWAAPSRRPTFSNAPR